MRDLEAEPLGQLVPDRNGLDSVGVLQVKVDDLHARELVLAARALGDVAQLGRALIPIVGDQREGIGEDAPVGGVGAAVADGE